MMTLEKWLYLWPLALLPKHGPKRAAGEQTCVQLFTWVLRIWTQVLTLASTLSHWPLSPAQRWFNCIQDSFQILSLLPWDVHNPKPLFVIFCGLLISVGEYRKLATCVGRVDLTGVAENDETTDTHMYKLGSGGLCALVQTHQHQQQCRQSAHLFYASESRRQVYCTELKSQQAW